MIAPFLMCVAPSRRRNRTGSGGAEGLAPAPLLPATPASLATILLLVIHPHRGET